MPAETVPITSPKYSAADFRAANEALDKYGVHPAAKLFPLMSEHELVELANDIEQKGLLEPIVTHEGKILDGRNRFIACHLTGVEVGAAEVLDDPRFTTYEGDSPVSFVVSKNIKRRHLTESQRAMVAAGLMPLLKEEAKQRQGARTDLVANLPPSDFGKARDKAAELVGVSGRTVQHAVTVTEKGVPELAEAVKSGDLAVSKAAEITTLSTDQQQAALTEAIDRAARSATAGRPVTAGVEVACKYKIEKCVSRDERHLNLSEPYFDAAEGMLVATDSAVVVAVPAKAHGQGRSGRIDGNRLRFERGRLQQQGSKVVVVEVLEGYPYGKFPDWRSAVPQSRRGQPDTVTVGLNVRLLSRVADALGADAVELTIPLEPKLPGYAGDGGIHVRAGGGDPREVAVLMPCRVAPPASESEQEARVIGAQVDK